MFSESQMTSSSYAAKQRRQQLFNGEILPLDKPSLNKLLFSSIIVSLCDQQYKQLAIYVLGTQKARLNFCNSRD